MRKPHSQILARVNVKNCSDRAKVPAIFTITTNDNKGTKTSFCCYLYTISPLSIPYYFLFLMLITTYHPPPFPHPSQLYCYTTTQSIYIKKDDISKTKKVSFYFFGGLKTKTKNVTLRIWLPKLELFFQCIMTLEGGTYVELCTFVKGENIFL